MPKILALMVSAAYAVTPTPMLLFQLTDAVNQACGCQISRLETNNNGFDNMAGWSLNFPPGITTAQQAAAYAALKSYVPPGGQ